ncbi:YibE/F family protein [Gordonia sp. ABSL1-1]|uniref:YibE/F family protein n=1 Tax=Gordonia sp. ABSL1-1 TaxID=3053923 RepID=UPI0025741AB0|nr:YibE/F family protein [Gordonia sp. ABSL1-1]MDL9938460.1 YibE/F family protein [Gordonia sp. ABSL1-1]
MTKWIVIGVLSIAGLAVTIGAVALWPTKSDHPIPILFQSSDGKAIETVDGEVVDQFRANCLNSVSGEVQETADIPVNPVPGGPCILSTVRLDSGPSQGRYTVLEVPTGRAGGATGPGAPRPDPNALDEPMPGQPTLKIGDAIRLSTVPGVDGTQRYTFFDFQRGTALLIWALLFVGAVVLVAAWRGLRSIIGLAFAFLVLGVFTLPAILEGSSPVAVALVSSAAILFVVLYLAHGVSLRTSSALLGTLTSLVMAAILSKVAIDTMKLTGMSGEQTANLQIYQGTISVSGLLLAGFIIGTLGVLNDVTITQASAAFELAAAGEPTRLATFRAAMRVGRDHIASTVYTLVFAYAGSALPLLLLFSVAQQPFGSLVTTETVAVELARTFVGGIAIALSVPLTTAIAAALVAPTGAAPMPATTATPAPARPRPKQTPQGRPTPTPATAAPPVPAPPPTTDIPVSRSRHARPD